MKDKTTKEEMDRWFGLLGDAERAEVLKVRICEEAKTERTRLEQEGQTSRDDDVIEKNATVKLAALAVIALGFVCFSVGWGNCGGPKTPGRADSAPANTTQPTTQTPAASGSVKEGL